MEPQRLAEAFNRTAERDPSAQAFTFLTGVGGETSYSFEHLSLKVADLAGKLKEAHIDGGGPLGLLLTSVEDQVLYFLAALQSGCVPAILTPPNRKLNGEYYLRTTATVIERSGFSAVITDVAELSLAAKALSPTEIERGEIRLPGDDRGQSSGLGSIDAAFLQFSSGTTGMKRGVLISHDSVLAQIDAYAGALGIHDRDVILSWLPLYHDMGLIACLNLPLVRGVHTVMMDPIAWVGQPSTFITEAARWQATLSWNPNFAYAFMAQRVPDKEIEGADLSSLRALVNCSEPVSYSSQRQFADRFAKLGLSPDVFRGCYAMAETTFALTHGDATHIRHLDHLGPTNGTPRPEGDPYVSVGAALPGVEIIVKHADGTTANERHIGEIWARSPFNFSGYFNEPQATAAAIEDGWYRTGDLGYFVGELLYVTGRLKDVFIVGGVNVFPQDIEATVSDVVGVQPGRVASFASFDERRGTERITVLAESTLQAKAAVELRVTIRQRILATFQIANFEVHIVQPQWLVKSSSGKMARRANQEKWDSLQNLGTASGASREVSAAPAAPAGRSALKDG